MFDKPSTRTRVSFETGVFELGGHPLILRQGELQMARGESPRDVALVLSRMVHAIGIRTGPHETVVELAEHSSVPVINMLTHEHHPCQALADLMTLLERFGTLEGLKLAYVGDGNNMTRSLLIAGRIAGVEVAVASPPELSLPEAPGVDIAEAVRGAHAIYTDVWVSMGDEDDAERRRELLAPYRIDADLLAQARDDAIVLHCLPAHPGEEITEDVLYGERSAVWDQAENRLHAQKALLEHLLFQHMKKLLALILACLALGLVAAGCGGSDDDNGGSSGDGASTTEEPAGGGGGGGAQVGMQNIQFDPKDVTVAAGEEITFTNDEAIPHDVHKTSGPGADFSSGDTGGMQEGDTFKLTLDEAGKYEYVCKVHAPGMAGTITVK